MYVGLSKTILTHCFITEFQSILKQQCCSINVNAKYTLLVVSTVKHILCQRHPLHIFSLNKQVTLSGLPNIQCFCIFALF